MAAKNKKLNFVDLSEDELFGEIETMEREYQRMKFDHAIKGLENPITLRELRRDIARLQTEVRKREMAEMTPEEIANRSKIRRRRSGK